MKKSDFYYDLPEELIAQRPVEPRDSSRLLCYDRAADTVTHRRFFDLPDLIKKGDILVINNTKVLPARLFGVKKETGAQVETLLHKRLNLTDWEALTRPAKRLKIGTEIVFSNELSAQVLKDGEDGLKILRFVFSGVFEDILYRLGEMPLPPYIHEKTSDKDRYQTVYARHEGSSAAPTAGLHFTPALLDKLREKGAEIAEVLLHVGLGTFRPVAADDLTAHKMHSEYYEITEAAAQTVNRALDEGRRVIAVGTTSVRVLESAAQGGRINAKKGETDIFIYPPYKFKAVSGLITNFHLPESTLIMLVSALIGREKILDIYKQAIDEKYRFFSFGDAMILL